VPLEASYDTYRAFAFAFAITVRSRVALRRAGFTLKLLEGNATG
jgi:hypothetical protein